MKHSLLSLHLTLNAINNIKSEQDLPISLLIKFDIIVDYLTRLCQHTQNYSNEDKLISILNSIQIKIELPVEITVDDLDQIKVDLETYQQLKPILKQFE